VVSHQLAVLVRQRVSALLATLSLQAAPMTDSKNNPPHNSLPAELELALRGATSRALSALHSLRMAVYDHVRRESSRGASLNEIDDGLRSMIEACRPKWDHDDYPADRAEEVRKQVLKWSAGFYPRTE
jgi:hypothetical protein